MIRLRPIHPRMTIKAPDVTPHTTIQASRTMGCAYVSSGGVPVRMSFMA